MSIQLMARAFEPDIPVEGTEQVLLLKLCDLANDEGWCWPGVTTLAKAIRREERQTQRLLRLLRKRGLIEVVVGGGMRHTNRYRITLPAKPSPSSTGNPRTTPETVSPKTPSFKTVSPSDQKPRHPGAETPSPECRNGVTATTPEPSRTTKTPHPPREPEGGGGGTTSPSATRDERQACFVRVLTRLSVCDGPKAAYRWWTLAQQCELATSFEDRCALIGWCVDTARARGRKVQFASDVVDLVDQWIPADALPEGEAEPAQTT